MNPENANGSIGIPPTRTRRVTRITILLGALCAAALLAWATVALAAPTNLAARARLRAGQNQAQAGGAGAAQTGQAVQGSQAGRLRQRLGQGSAQTQTPGAEAGSGTGTESGAGADQEARKQKMQELAKELGLTPEQRQKIRAILQPHREEIRDLVDKIKQTHEALKQAAEARPPDDKAVQAAGAELGTLIAEGAKLRATVGGEVKSVLTPEQAQKLQQLRESRQKAGGKGLFGGAASGEKAK